jgi:flagellar export protein FliJ
MSGFKFSLQRLLELRAAAERLREADLGQALAAERVREAASSASQAQLERVHHQGVATPESLAGFHHLRDLAANAAQVQVDADAAALAAASAARDDALDRLHAAQRARKSLERLRERQADVWAIEAGRREQADQDEIARQRTRPTDHREDG